MRATSPSAFMLSLALHGVVVALVVAFSFYVARRSEIAPPVIFDLVAGPPTAPEQLEAPALGNPEFEVPKAPVQKTQPQPEPEPVVETVAPPVAPPEPVPTPPKVQKKTPPKPEPKKTETKKTETRKTEAKKAPPKVSYEEHQKKYGKAQAKKSASNAPRITKVPRIDAEGIAAGVKGGSTSNKKGGGGGKALTREEADAMDVYEALVRNKLQIAHDEVKPTGLGDGLTADVEFHMAANGEISSIRIVRSSGNEEFDRSVIAAFRRITWPGPRPDKKSDRWRLTFKMTED